MTEACVWFICRMLHCYCYMEEDFFGKNVVLLLAEKYQVFPSHHTLHVKFIIILDTFLQRCDNIFCTSCIFKIEKKKKNTEWLKTEKELNPPIHRSHYTTWAQPRHIRTEQKPSTHEKISDTLNRDSHAGTGNIALVLLQNKWINKIIIHSSFIFTIMLFCSSLIMWLLF